MNSKTDFDAILSGQPTIVSHPGASQYNAGGIAACGLASLNFVRVAFARVEAGIIGRRLVEDLVSRQTSEEIIHICSRWQSNGHLEVEDIAQVPLFERALELESSTFNVPSFDHFLAMLSSLESLPQQHAAIVITRPPEIVSCLKLPIEVTSEKSGVVFVIFDSHPRPSHPDGAGLIINASVAAAAAHLDNLLKVDGGLLADHGLQWQTQLLANFSGHCFIPKSQPVNTLSEMTKSVMDSSLAVLAKQAEVDELRIQIAALMRDRQSLELELNESRARLRTAKHASKDKSSSRSSYRDAVNVVQPRASSSKVSSPVLPPSARNALEYFHNPSNVQRPEKTRVESSDYQMAKQVIEAGSSRRNNGDSKRYQNHYDGDLALAAQLQRDWDRQDMRDVEKLREKQRQYEAEYARLNAERVTLQAMQQKLFRCPLCFEDLPEDDVALVSNCTHQLCRPCMKNYVTSRLADKIYPIFCPVCLAESTTSSPGMITDELAQILGLTDVEYHVLQELQIASLSILIHCRKCKEGVFVDRGEHDAAEIIGCPLPRCNFVWCKACQQEIVSGGPKHSCDGSSEMDHLLAQRGWRRCPHCKTAFQKSSGCNHMTCLAPGCNTHFCYLCGDMIVRSALAKEIRTGVSDHYRRCQLFEDVPER
ncbi:RING-type domain-containing protein [Mycena indigotica]|uniref:RBR-type E3 ubiquitin transferase n=1 Tax=Mycena indigotica TaxID=2126181 RepID=A0A8H6T311_9AGAR|nr:RING-type domain-containing protein [Mycena indigotica]KAF7309964.1 RING-type domain-containing protein [Mycena indigotica]